MKDEHLHALGALAMMAPGWLVRGTWWPIPLALAVILFWFIREELQARKKYPTREGRFPRWSGQKWREALWPAGTALCAGLALALI